MRLLHKSLIHVLPTTLLLEQLDECRNVVTQANAYNGILKDYEIQRVMFFNKSHFYNYCCIICNELFERGVEVHDSVREPILEYVDDEAKQTGAFIEFNDLFKGWHDNRYLKQCYYILQERFDCGKLEPNNFIKIRDYVSQELDEHLPL